LKFTIIFHCKTLQKFLKFAFLVWNHTIWQHWLGTYIDIVA
jgi:hypothetical protein